jgi:hypothetical protein
VSFDADDGPDDVVAGGKGADWYGAGGAVVVANGAERPRDREQRRSVERARDLERRGYRKAGPAAEDLHLRERDRLARELQPGHERPPRNPQGQRAQLQWTGSRELRGDVGVGRAAPAGFVGRSQAQPVCARRNDERRKDGA